MLPDVSIHTPTWGVTQRYFADVVRLMFQATLPHGEWLHAAIAKHDPEEFQSTLPHGEWLAVFELSRLFSVSIHTPTWGVTCYNTHSLALRTSFNPHSHMGSDEPKYRPFKNKEVSIHTPTWGVTSFQIFLRCKRCVSIHTPTWGVTAFIASWQLLVSSFNPHSHMGSDSSAQWLMAQPPQFQSTLPHGEWPYSIYFLLIQRVIIPFLRKFFLWFL